MKESMCRIDLTCWISKIREVSNYNFIKRKYVSYDLKLSLETNNRPTSKIIII